MYTPSMFKILLPSTTHREGLLRVVSLPYASTYSQPWHGMAQHVVFDHVRLPQPHECSRQAKICHANSAVQAAFNSI